MTRRGTPILAMGVLTVLGAALIAPLPRMAGTQAAQAWWDFLHVPAFAILTVCLAHIVRKMSIGAWLTIILLVPALELLQSFTGRDASVFDVLYGWTGALAGVVIYFTWFAPVLRWPFSSGVLSLIVVATLIYPVAITHEQSRRARSFPVLTSFDSRWESIWWSITSCAVSRKDGWTVTIQDYAPYPALFLRDFTPDWSAMTHLCIDLFLEGEAPLPMWVRLDDRPGNPPYGQRFQQMSQLQPGRQTLCLSRDQAGRTSGGQPMNLSTIAQFGLFFHGEDAGRMVRLHKIYLVLADGDSGKTSVANGLNSAGHSR